MIRCPLAFKNAKSFTLLFFIFLSFYSHFIYIITDFLSLPLSYLVYEIYKGDSSIEIFVLSIAMILYITLLPYFPHFHNKQFEGASLFNFFPLEITVQRGRLSIALSFFALSTIPPAESAFVLSGISRMSANRRKKIPDRFITK